MYLKQDTSSDTSYLANLCGNFIFTNKINASVFNENDLYTYYLKFSLEKSTGIPWRLIPISDEKVPHEITVAVQRINTYENVVNDISVETNKAWEDVANNSTLQFKWQYICANGTIINIAQAEDQKCYICLNS